jgi:hypothetical protein
MQAVHKLYYPDASSNGTEPKMFCCGKHHIGLSASKREDTLFHKASAALIELLLKIRNVDCFFHFWHTEVTEAKEREDATKFAMETCRRKGVEVF